MLERQETQTQIKADTPLPTLVLVLLVFFFFSFLMRSQNPHTCPVLAWAKLSTFLWPEMKRGSLEMETEQPEESFLSSLSKKKKKDILNHSLQCTQWQISGTWAWALHTPRSACYLFPVWDGTSLIYNLSKCLCAEVWPWAQEGQASDHRDTGHLEVESDVSPGVLCLGSCSSPSGQWQICVSSFKGWGWANATHPSWKWCMSRFLCFRVCDFWRVNMALKGQNCSA